MSRSTAWPLTNTKTYTKAMKPHVSSQFVRLDDGRSTRVHIARYYRSLVQPKLVLFKERERLLEWCLANSYSNAISGGFFLRSAGKMLDETWLNGAKLDSQPFGNGWSGRRGSIYIPRHGRLEIGPRNTFDGMLSGDLLEAGPTLVREGVSLYEYSSDPEGFSETAYQHDEDIDCKRHPRAAIGVNDEFILCVVVDGRTDIDAGMYLCELAKLMLDLGANNAVNLDGGSSASLIVSGKLSNRPRTTKWVEPHPALLPTEHFYEGERVFENLEGFPVHSAILLI